jgi:SSS family solute:Na+ symporter
MSLQLWILVMYFVVVNAIGVIASKLARSSDDFLVAGRSLTLPICAAVIAGEWIGGTSTIGTAESAYIYGISAGWYVIANVIGTIVLAYTLARVYRRGGYYTVAELLEEHYGVGGRVTAGVVLAFVMIIASSVQIVAGATLIRTLTGLSSNISIVITGIVFLIYTLAGGLVSIGYTNMIHMVMIYVGIFWALFISSRDVGGVSMLVNELPAYPYFSLVGTGTGTVIARIMSSILAALVAQAAVQPIMAAKDERTAQQSTLVAACLIVPIGLATTLMGMFARVGFPGIAPREALPMLLTNMTPLAGGIVLAGIAAAILSTVAPCILAAGTLLASDVYRRVLNPSASDAQIYRVSRWITFVCGLLAMVWAMYCKIILDQIYFAYSLRAPIAILAVIAVYGKRIPTWVGAWSLGLTTVAALCWEGLKAVNGCYPMNVDITYVTVLVTICVVFVGRLVTMSKED